MRGLGRTVRAVLASGAFLAFAGAFAGDPLGARGAQSLVARPSPSATGRNGVVPVVMPRRDPFAGGPAPARTNTVRPDLSTPRTPALPPPFAPLPPNAGAGGGPFPVRAAHAVVRAVVTGAHPFALVESEGETRLVTLGDTVDGASVTAIAADGIHLANDHTIGVAASPAPRAGIGVPSP
jgi:hypothetical protein